jgi:hypothetical protein
VPSGAPDHPFEAGQILQVDNPPPEILALVDGVRAVALRDTEPELATVRAPRRSRIFERTKRKAATRSIS